MKNDLLKWLNQNVASLRLCAQKIRYSKIFGLGTIYKGSKILKLIPQIKIPTTHSIRSIHRFH